MKDKTGRSFRIGITISVYGGAENEKTMLAVAVDDGTRCHHALQLILDTNAIITRDRSGVCLELTHNGKINIGRKGSARIREVLAFISGEMPSFVKDDNRIHLGRFHCNELISVTSSEFDDFFNNLTNYVLLLERFREMKLQQYTG